MFNVYKRVLLSVFLMLFLASATKHPIYVTVTEIQHNSTEKTMEITCKIFTNDFETVLKNLHSNEKIDIVRPVDKAKMNQWVSQYIQNHLKIAVDKKKCLLKFVGYEQIEDCILVYLQIDGVTTFRSVAVTDNLLYDYKSEQISLIHCIKNGVRKSTKLNNPEAGYEFIF